MAKDESGRGVKEQLGALLKTVGSAAVSFAEFARVRLLRDLESDGYRLKRDMAGTVVAIYGGGAAYAVEFAELDGGMAVVTIKAADLTGAVEQ